MLLQVLPEMSAGNCSRQLKRPYNTVHLVHPSCGVNLQNCEILVMYQPIKLCSCLVKSHRVAAALGNEAQQQSYPALGRTCLEQLEI